ncbi:DNA polymerase Y family protein [Sphingomonas sp. MMS24-JH45]
MAVKEVAAFFDTGRSTAGAVARVCAPEAPSAPPPGMVDDAPLVTVHKVGSRIEVAAASPAARALGAEPGMALTQLRAAVPGIAVRDADPAGDAAALHRLATALARRWTPVVAVSDADGLFLDLTGVAHLHGGEAAMAWRLVRGLARLGIAARVGIADTAGAAWALARYAGERVATLPPGDPLPALAALRSRRSGSKTARSTCCGDWGGQHRCARRDAARAARATLRPRGAAPARPGERARARAARSRRPARTDRDRTALRRTVADRRADCALAGGAVARLAVALATAGLGARAVALVATRIDTARQVVRIGLARPTRAPDDLLRLLARRIETLDPGFGIEALALHVLRADPLGPEVLAEDLATETTPDLAPLVDALVNRIGATRLWRARAVESDVPERAVAATTPLDPPGAPAPRLRGDDVRRLDTRVAVDPWHPRWPRPVRLLRRPEPVDHVMAQLPDAPPVRFTWRGVTHSIVRGDGPERITGEWWRRTREAHAVRDYFAVEDDAGGNASALPAAATASASRRAIYMVRAWHVCVTE